MRGSGMQTDILKALYLPPHQLCLSHFCGRCTGVCTLSSERRIRWIQMISHLTFKNVFRFRSPLNLSAFLGLSLCLHLFLSSFNSLPELLFMDTLQDSSWKDTYPPANLQKGLVICTIFQKTNNGILLDIMPSKFVLDGIMVQRMSQLIACIS